MKFIDEYRDPEAARGLARRIAETTTRPWTIMEVCGGQTHCIVRFGVDQLLPDEITLVHGPGCPVCVTSVETIDRAIAIASREDVIFCSFGDMLRVPGTGKDLLAVRSQGGDVRIVYSPMDALEIARENVGKQVVFFSVGFETTAPATAMAVHQAREQGLRNFSMLVAHVLVPPAMEAVIASPGNRVNGFLAAGHVCTVTGYADYEPVAKRHKVPIVVTGFEPVDILQGIDMVISQLERGATEVENQYSRVVRREGNRPAMEFVERLFAVCDRNWRGIGMIPESGWRLRDDYAGFDAEKRFDIGDIVAEEDTECISGLILQGAKKPHECPAFGTRCTSDHPLGATMVSSEGACAAYWRYRRAPKQSA